MSFRNRIAFLFRLTSACAVVLVCTQLLSAQSTNQNYPTPITTNEIGGTIKARDVGDNRVTSFYYQFDTNQGDLFINLLTKNFTGDIDVFTMTGLMPLAKIAVYADYGDNETGRVLYFRKPERLILRVQGRTPSDDPATFRIKFAGSFMASRLAEPTADPELPTVASKNESGIRVNSVGTIVEVIPKPTPTPRAVATVTEEKPEPTKSEAEVKTDTEVKTAATTEPTPTSEEPRKKLEVTVTDTIPDKSVSAETRPGTRRNARGQRRTPPKPAATAPAETVAETPSEKPPVTPPTEPATTATETPTTTSTTARRGAKSTKPAEAKSPDPLANINLVISFKDGSSIQRPMNEVLRFSVDKGVLTVIAKDGSIGRYSILDVAKVTIE